MSSKFYHHQEWKKQDQCLDTEYYQDLGFGRNFWWSETTHCKTTQKNMDTVGLKPRQHVNPKGEHLLNIMLCFTCINMHMDEGEKKNSMICSSMMYCWRGTIEVPKRHHWSTEEALKRHQTHSQQHLIPSLRFTLPVSAFFNIVYYYLQNRLKKMTPNVTWYEWMNGSKFNECMDVAMIWMHGSGDDMNSLPIDPETHSLSGWIKLKWIETNYYHEAWRVKYCVSNRLFWE